MIVKSLSVGDEQLSELESNLDVSNGYSRGRPKFRRV